MGAVGYCALTFGSNCTSQMMKQAYIARKPYALDLKLIYQSFQKEIDIQPPKYKYAIAIRYVGTYVTVLSNVEQKPLMRESIYM